ncbi:nuclear factor 7, ovary-like isoform X1 [Sebastes umbrosus]|uniref:nuclear factor 7, ovary-like isoform X1 n=1 Tax=Sebastes umbrosus TaxID=72105 RepID=UPI00189DB287|nr:nuclear factor 7, ovary-like isoform X1 [Sebastes umbrosus]
MASALYSQDLTCPICWTIFTDPVTLTCGHSFCRECITDVLSSQHRCPQCGTAVPTERLPTSHILKSLAEKAKEAEKVKKRKEKAEVAELCLEHEEKLKLFCVTDQQLACIICRDGDTHEGHKFKPIKEAAASLRQELEKGMQNLCGDILFKQGLANTQRDEITKNKEKSQQLMTQIFRQFEEMHQFLRKREDEIKNELKHKEEDAAEKMRERLNAIETALSESRQLEGKLTSVLKIEDSARLLKSWTECNSRMSPEHVFRPKANDLQVVNTSLSLGPYESHLQFFIWKEMLQVIQPRAELLSLKSNSTDITVSDDGRSLFCTPESNQASLFYSSDDDYDTESYQNTGYGRSILTGPGKPQSFGASAQLGQNRAYDWHALRKSGKPKSFGATTRSGQNRAFDQGTFTGSGQTQASSSTKKHVFSVNEFSSGQHYWEIEVGHRDYWELGIKDNFLKYDGKKYATCRPDKTTELEFGDRPRKIGIYLNCASKKLSFYDADNMTRIHAMSSPLMSMPLSAYFNIRVRAPDPNPLTVCWY